MCGNKGVILKILISDMSKDDWEVSAKFLRDELKAEIQGADGFWKTLRDDLNEKEQKEDIKRQILGFKDSCPIDDVDGSVNSLALKIWQINESFTSKLSWDIGFYLENSPLDLFNNRPYISAARKTLNDPEISERVKRRLLGICQQLIYSSISQGNKSNAGSVGESLVEAIFASEGLVRNVDYRTQYKSNVGSDTDFVIPFIEDFYDSQIEVLIAVQMSTNDRARLVASELKTGGIKYMFSGNGLDASSKKLKDIGDQIIQSLLKDNVKMICYAPGLEEEKIRLKNKISNENDIQVSKARLDYFEQYAITYTQFRKNIKRWCQKSKE